MPLMRNILAQQRLAFDSGAMAALAKGVPLLQVRKRFTVAEVNAGATILAAPGLSHKFRMVDYSMIAIGGNAATATDIRILATQEGSAVALAIVAVAGLTRSTVNKPNSANNTVLADGASFVANDVNTAITIGKTGGTLATATHIDVILTFAADEV